jgi:low affinity Fe/Cu permease
MIDRHYSRLANAVSEFVGSVWSLLILVAAIVGTGIYFDFSPEWELRLVTVIGLISVLAIFFLQRSQRHDDKATQLKLDELIKAVEGARNELAQIEKEPEEVIEKLASDHIRRHT